jgi:hypothetical protein
LAHDGGHSSHRYRSARRDARHALNEERALRATLAQQLGALQQMFEDQGRIRFSRTLLGRFYNVLGYFFSAYCVYKMVNSARSILRHGDGLQKMGLDPVTRAISLLARYAEIAAPIVSRRG